MNCLSMERKVKILSALVEGCSIRSIERMTDTHRDTIMRLLVRAGNSCQDLLDENLKGFHSSLIQVDEIWTYVKKKAKRLTPEEQLNTDIGDQYVFAALDAETKLVPLFTVGKREPWSTFQFVKELHKKLRGNGRIQLTTDGFLPYIPAIEKVFGADIDYAQTN